MARRIVTAEERAQREARAAHMQALAAECSRTKCAIRAAGLHSQPQYWLNRACREELGAAPYALADELLPAAIRVAKRMTFQVEQYVAALPPRRSKALGGMEYDARMAGLKDALRCEVRRAKPEAGITVSHGSKTLGDYVMERFRAKARAGPVPATQVPKTTNPTVGAAGFGSSRRSDLECRNVTKPTTPAARPQLPPDFRIKAALEGNVDVLVDPATSPLSLEEDADVLTECARQLGIVARAAHDDEDGRHCADVSGRLLSMAIGYRRVANEMKAVRHD